MTSLKNDGGWFGDAAMSRRPKTLALDHLALEQVQVASTAEVRWFYGGSLPPAILAWFGALEGEPGEPTWRTDHYLRLPDTDGLGIKLREGRIEIKQRYHQAGMVTFRDGVSGAVEHWRKWSLPIAGLLQPLLDAPYFGSSWIAVAKERRLRRYRLLAGGGVGAAPPGSFLQQGCEMELTQVRIGGLDCWTLGLEAFGPENGLEAILRATAEQVSSGRLPPFPWVPKDSHSYPRWLAGWE